jgi:SAM-dependent methyltransferase
MRRTSYDAGFYFSNAGGSMRSAREILKIVKYAIDPKSVVDVGCGIGTWLKVWMDFGVEDVLGIDGDYVQLDQLLIPPDRFRPMDLRKPEPMTRQFDLVQSLEVAEHLPKAYAEAFISFLCSLGKVVLFSAAVPHQVGVKHVNEQWPEYWAEIFMRKGFIAVDAIRDQVWDNPNVEWWYCQNTLVFVQAVHLMELDGLRHLTPVSRRECLSRIHPRLWVRRNERSLSLDKLLVLLPGGISGFCQTVFSRLRKTIRQ